MSYVKRSFRFRAGEPMKRYVKYLRVSTREQGRSGLGLEGQERDINHYLQTHHQDTPYEVVGRFVEVHSGSDDSRPQLLKSIELVKEMKGILIVSKLDRLSRKVSFISKLMEDKDLELVVSSLPNSTKFQLHIYSCLSEQERDFISQRTKSGLQSLKDRGVKLGTPQWNLDRLVEAKKEKHRQDCQKISHLLIPFRSQGMSLHGICNVLNTSGMTTERGTKFHPSLVSRMIKTLGV